MPEHTSEAKNSKNDLILIFENLYGRGVRLVGNKRDNLMLPLLSWKLTKFKKDVNIPRL